MNTATNQIPNSNQSQPQINVDYISPQPTQDKHKNNLLMTIIIILGFVITGIGGFYLGTLQGKQDSKVLDKTPPESQPTQTTQQPKNNTQAQDSRIIASLPKGWTYKTNGNCKVQIPVPPKQAPYYYPHDENRPLSVTEDQNSGRFWDFPTGSTSPLLISRLIEDPNTQNNMANSQASIMYVTESEAGGYISSAVAVRCVTNSNAISSEQMLGSLKTQLEKYNSEDNRGEMMPEKLDIQKTSPTQRWGNQVYDLTVSNKQYTVFASPEFIYEIEVFGDTENEFVKKTARQIFDNLKFE